MEILLEWCMLKQQSHSLGALRNSWQLKRQRSPPPRSWLSLYGFRTWNDYRPRNALRSWRQSALRYRRPSRRLVRIPVLHSGKQREQRQPRRAAREDLLFKVTGFGCAYLIRKNRNSHLNVQQAYVSPLKSEIANSAPDRVSLWQPEARIFHDSKRDHLEVSRNEIEQFSTYFLRF